MKKVIDRALQLKVIGRNILDLLYLMERGQRYTGMSH